MAELVRRSTVIDSDKVSVGLLVLTAPFLLAASRFPRPVVIIAIVALLLPIFLRYYETKRLTRYAPANYFIAGLIFLCLPLSLLLTPALWDVTWPRASTLIWSVALYFTLINLSPAGSHPDAGDDAIPKATIVFLLMGAVVALIGILGMRSVAKLFYLPLTGAFAGLLGFEDGLPTNEIAGVLTLFIPVAAALIIGSFRVGRRRTALWLLPLILLLLATLVLSQSRTGWTATLAGLFVVVVSALRIDRKWVIAILAIGLLGVLLITVSGSFDRFVFAGANSWASVVRPRLSIWQQAVHGIGDHSLWGMGFGLFGHLARLVYPHAPVAATPIIEDAHNLYLQTTLDFGLIGGLIFLGLLIVTTVTAVRLARSSPQQGWARYSLIGFLGALVAHMLYSLTDAVSLGTIGSVFLWYLLGLIMMMAPDRPPRVVESVDPAWWFGGLVAGGIILSIWFWFALPVNRAGQLTARSLMNQSSPISETAPIVSRMADHRCRARWFEGRLYHEAGTWDVRNMAWGDLLGCTDRYTGYMAVLAPSDAELARLAIRSQPSSADAYFWLASAIVENAPEESIDLYRQGLAFAPHDGARWQVLGDLLSTRDPVAAEAAYLESCTNGDPGANGCLRAGGMAEARGDIPRAVYYYRLSKYSDARERADYLDGVNASDG